MQDNAAQDNTSAPLHSAFYPYTMHATFLGAHAHASTCTEMYRPSLLITFCMYNSELTHASVQSVDLHGQQVSLNLFIMHACN